MNTKVKELLEKTCEKYGMSFSQAAREMGYSGPVLSAYRSGTYSGDVEKLENAVVVWAGRTEQAHARKKIPTVETADLKKIVNAIGIAHTEKDIALIVADAGAGKSTAVRFYQDKNPRTTLVINVVSGMNRKMLVTDIARQLGLDTVRVQLNALISTVAATLAERNMVVILDEADYLKPDALEFTRRLVYDLGSSGLVLVGLPRLKGYIQNLRNDHRQLESRIGVFLPLGGLTKSDARIILNSVWEDAGDEILNAIYNVSRTDTRQFCKIIERAQNTMLINKVSKPDTDIIELASRLVIRRNWR